MEKKNQTKNVYELIKSMFAATTPQLGRLKRKFLIKGDLLQGSILQRDRMSDLQQVWAPAELLLALLPGEHPVQAAER